MKFDTGIQQQIRADNRGYKGPKPSSKDWADMLEEDPDFAEEFKSLFKNSNITKADDFTPEVFEDTYVDM